MAIVKEVLYYNSFWLKQLQQDDTNVNAVAVYPGGYPYNDATTFGQQVIGIATFVAGTGYSVENNIATTDTSGTGTGLTVDIITVGAGGAINKIKIRNRGSGYANAAVLSISGGTSGTITLRVLNANGNSTTASYNFPGTIDLTNNKGNFIIEESRIRGGYNNTQVGLGAKAYLAEEESLQENRFNSLIYSGIFNSRTGVNDTNQFSIGEDITKSAPPAHGSIQKLHADDNNLIVLQENKINRALIDKDAIYSAEGNATITSRFQVIGELIPYNGDFGISRNPESFASYGFQRYFTDKDRNSVLRLSRDGLTEISRYGMLDFFRDELTNLPETTEVVIGSRQPVGNPLAYTITSAIPPAPAANITTKNITINEPASVLVDVQKGMQFLINNLEQIINNKTVYVTQVVGQVITLSQSVTIALGDGITLVAPTRGQIVGGYDIHNKNYIVSIQQKPTWAVPLANDVATGENANYKTLAFDELINGWTSFYTYKPTFSLSLKNKHYTVKDQNIYEHYAALTGNNRGTFYSVYKKSNIEFVFNQNSSVAKNFLTVNYEGDNGWQIDSFISDAQRFDYGTTNPLADYESNNDTTPIVKSYYDGAYDSFGNTYSTNALIPPIFRYGFDRKENKYYGVLKNNSVPKNGEVLYGKQISGIKGRYATVTISTDNLTDIGGVKELWSVGSRYAVSSY